MAPVWSREFLDIQENIVWIHSEMLVLHDKNIESGVPVCFAKSFIDILAVLQFNYRCCSRKNQTKYRRYRKRAASIVRAFHLQNSRHRHQYIRLRHMKNKGTQQLHSSSRNSEAIDTRATHRIGVWWRVMIIPFRTP